MRDERPERVDKTELLERGRAQIGQNAPVLALQFSDLSLDCARSGACSGLIADGLRQHRRACAQSEQMRSELVVQLVRDKLTLLVVGVEDAFHEVIVGAFQSVERLRKRIYLRIEVADLRGSVSFGARGIIAGPEFRKRRSGDAEGPHRAPDQKAGHGDRRERHQSALERVLPRFVPDLVDLVRRISDQDDRRRAAIVQRNRNDSCFGRRASKGAKPTRRLGLLVRLAENCRSKRRIANSSAHVPQMLKAGHEVLDPLRFRRSRRKGEGCCDEILRQPHRALRFDARSPPCLPDVMDRVGHKPESEERGKDEIEPVPQGD